MHRKLFPIDWRNELFGRHDHPRYFVMPSLYQKNNHEPIIYGFKLL